MIGFEKLFKIFSYAAVFCGFLSLWVSGTFGLVETALFIGVMVLAWFLEGSRWLISERLGTVLIVLALPIYYLLWRYRFFDFSNSESMLPGILARLILSLTAIKLLQKKSDRDWMFLYVMSFFEVLLGAGLSIGIGYFLAFAAYVFVMIATIILFEIRKTDRQTREKSASELKARPEGIAVIPLKRVLGVSIAMIFMIALIAVPTFFMLPRVGGAGLGGNPGGVSTISGFSDRVKLGGIGRIQQNDEVVMRVRVENDPPDDIRWRGVALDTFDGQSWSMTKSAVKEPRFKNERDLIQVNTAKRQEGLTLQTVYLEPLDTPVIFGLNRMIGVQGNFPILYRDPHGSITFQRSGERISYRLVSDTEVPSETELRKDRTRYNAESSSYLQLPQVLDPRIPALAKQITAKANNRYDASKAIESYLQDSFGYTLEQKASGSDPLSDFLFSVREGHCEYFATAMAVMLRTQGIATRVVNGFQKGEYNETADVYVVRQRNAHSWVEVYFPETESWVAFDPTPFAGQTNGSAAAGLAGSFRKFTEALETFWIQYFVAFDNQEQRSLFVAVRRSLVDYESGISAAWNVAQDGLAEWWTQVRGDEGLTSSLAAIGKGVLISIATIFGILLLVWLSRKIVRSKVWRSLWERLFVRQRASVVEFYERMVTILAAQGQVRLPHQTPLEFAYAVGVPEALNITEKYNRVRFGEKQLSSDDAKEIERWLKVLKEY